MPRGRPPVFKHDANTGVMIRNRKRLLCQNGRLFTNAEFNRFTGKWEPEPKPIDMGQLWEEENRDNINRLKKEIAGKQAELDRLYAEKPNG